jgi:succinate dehydrogenase/fumarate reductase flavoprotein subunit
MRRIIFGECARVLKPRGRLVLVDSWASAPAYLVRDNDRAHGHVFRSPKSNWANPLDTSPFTAYAVTCGVTFTFGGLRIVPETAQAVDLNFNPIPGLYAAGEMVGGIFYFNYPAGTGLVSGSVFGRIAGAAAADAALTC